MLGSIRDKLKTNNNNNNQQIRHGELAKWESGALEKSRSISPDVVVLPVLTLSTDTKFKSGDVEKQNPADTVGRAPGFLAVVLLSLLSIVVGAIFAGITAANIAEDAASLRQADLAVWAASLSVWLILIIVCTSTLISMWQGSVKAFTICLVALCIHYVLDLVIRVLWFIFTYSRDVTNPSAEACASAGLDAGCELPVNLMLILVTVSLILFKLATFYLLYAMYIYRKSLLTQEINITQVVEVQLPSSSSPSPLSSKPSPLTLAVPSPKKSPFVPRFKSPLRRDAREKRVWPPSNIPTIKIDLASDQSSASSYSNGDSGGAGFAVFEFSAKYPSLLQNFSPKANGSPPLFGMNNGPGGLNVWDEEKGDISNGKFWDSSEATYDSPKRSRATTSPWKAGGLGLADAAAEKIVTLPKYSFAGKHSP